MCAICPCTNPVSNYENLIINNSTLTNKFVGPYKDYDVPRTPVQQVILGTLFKITNLERHHVQDTTKILLLPF